MSSLSTENMRMWFMGVSWSRLWPCGHRFVRRQERRRGRRGVKGNFLPGGVAWGLHPTSRRYSPYNILSRVIALLID